VNLLAAAALIEIAVTFVDLPRSGPEVAGVTRLQTAQSILAVLRGRRLPPVYGFVNGKLVADHPEDKAILAAWVAAKNPLGNHTWSHSEPADLAAYLADIDRNEPLLRELMPGPDARWKVFRYPSLNQGETVSDRDAIRAHLSARGYRIAEPSLSVDDWAWTEAYARCRAHGDAAAVEELKAAFLESAQVSLALDDALARRAFGRRIPLVLTLHPGAFTALMLDALLALFQEERARFVPLETALADPAYQKDARIAPTHDELLQDEQARLRGLRLVPRPERPPHSLTQICL